MEDNGQSDNQEEDRTPEPPTLTVADYLSMARVALAASDGEVDAAGALMADAVMTWIRDQVMP